MIRAIFPQLLLFALPFIGYFVYRLLASRGQNYLEDTPWFVLSVTGLVLSLIAFVALGLVEDGQPGGHYVPAQYEDGQIIPGRIEPPE